MTEQSQEVATRASGASVVKAIPVPRELQELGLRFGQDEASGLRIVYLPDELRARVNVVNPTTSFTQADPNWTPGVSVVKVDIERDTYPIPGGKRGLSKQALETLSKAAGVLYTRTERVKRDELQEGELWAYRATVGFRRSDGTIDEVTRERGFNKEAEREIIEDDVTRARAGEGEGERPKFGERGSPTWEAEVRKRWLAELRFGPSKTESKAINRALRAGLSIPTSVSRQDAAKPWLVIGYNFTPDYSDPDVKRRLIEIGLNAQAAIYGGGEVSHRELEAPAETLVAEETEPEVEEDTPRGSSADAADSRPSPPGGSDPEAGDAGETRGGGDEQVGGGPSDDEQDTEPAAGSSDDDQEPTLERKAESVVRIPEKAIEQAGATKVKDDLTVAEVVAKGPPGREWLAWAARNPDAVGAAASAAIELFLSQRYAELWGEIRPAGD